MSSLVRQVRITPATRELLKKLPIATSAAVAQAIKAAGEDDNLLIKALKRRLAVGAVESAVGESTEMCRISVTTTTQTDHAVADLVLRSQLSSDEVIRLCIEAYLFKL